MQQTGQPIASQVLAIILVSLPLAASLMDCQILENGNPTTYFISQETIAATRKDATTYQIFHCKCPTNQLETFGDSEKSTYDRYHFQAGKKDWANSSLLVASDCTSLRINLGSSDKNSIHNTISGFAGVLVFNVGRLQVDNLDVGKVSSGDNHNQRITSLYFRNVTLENAKYDLIFEEKTEVVFDNVTFSKPVSIVMINSNTTPGGDPTFRLLNSRLNKKQDLANNLSPSSVNKIRLENSQVVQGGGCSHYDYQGIAEVRGNSLGFVVTGDIEFNGGRRIDFHYNNVDFIQTNGIKVINQKSVMMSSNILGMPTGPSPILLQYKQINRCNIDDLPFNDITGINFNRNMVSRNPGQLIQIEHGYQNNITSKMSVAGTGYLTICDCSYVQVPDNRVSSQVHLSMVDTSTCFYNSILVPRRSICGTVNANSGSLVLNNSPAGDGLAIPSGGGSSFYGGNSGSGTECGGGVGGSSTTAIIVGVVCTILSALITAVLVSICFRFCGEAWEGIQSCLPSRKGRASGSDEDSDDDTNSHSGSSDGSHNQA